MFLNFYDFRLREKAVGLRRGATAVSLLREEDRVERDRFSKRHAQNGLDEDLTRSLWVATYGLDGFSANETYTDSSSEAANSGRKGTSDFSDDHLCVLGLGFFSAHRAGDSLQVACLERVN
jgi:hypothetical protein